MRYFVLGCALLIAVTATAQVPGVSAAFGVHANLANLNVSGPLEEVYGMGYGGGAHLDVQFAVLSLRLSGDYITFSPDNDKYQAFVRSLPGFSTATIKVDGGRINIFSGNINAKLPFLPLPIVSPYITGGIGLVNLGADDANVTVNGTSSGSIPGVKGQTKTAANAGAGVDLKLGAFTLFAEGKYTWIFTEGETSTYIPFSIGITF
jgi:opacity protein-like surface antigen